MPVDSHYVDMGKGAHKRAHGVLTSTDLLVAALSQAQDVENARKLKYILYDLTDVTEVRVGHEAMGQLAELGRRTAELAPGGFIAIVAPDPLLFGMARNWQSLSGNAGWKSHVFQHRRDAIAWLRKQLGGGDPGSAAIDDYPSLKVWA